MCKIVEREETPALLEMQDISYYYEGEMFPVWEHLSCCFFEGKIHALCGPSGCGKSSVLYLLDGLIPHIYEGKLSGRVLLRGQEITEVLPRYRCGQIGFVMQNPESQFCTFTVEEELAFGMENLGVPREIMTEKIKEVLQYVGLPGYEAYDLNQLSGGQKQKVAIASLLVTEPEILLLDEPTANLDPVSRKQIFDLIVRLSREKNMTVILVEHNIDEIIESVDYMVVMNREGGIILNGKREHLIEEYRKLSNETALENETPVYEQAEDVLKIENLHFAYPEAGRRKKKEALKPIIRDLNLCIRSQEFLAIVGENGVGKTTLMRLIFRIQTQNEGRITLFGKPIDSYRKKELYRLIGLVFQNPENQFLANTVFDELMFSLKKVKISREEKEERVSGMLEKFHLEKEKEKSPFVLSQGQKRRLSVASMLLTDQKILFLDEPTYGQDYENRQELMKDMQALVREGVTIVMITHDLALVRQYATRVVEIENGTVRRNLPTEQFFLQTEAGGDV